MTPRSVPPIWAYGGEDYKFRVMQTPRWFKQWEGSTFGCSNRLLTVSVIVQGYSIKTRDALALTAGEASLMSSSS